MRALGALLAGTVALSALTPAQAVAQAGELRVLHWNIAGVTFTHPFNNDDPNNAGRLDVAIRLVDIAEERRPHLLSMNETCALQANFTRGVLEELFGSAEIHFADSAGTDILCDYSEGTIFESGNAIVAVGADSVSDRRTFYFTDDGLLTTTKTERSAACMVVSFASTLGQEVRACSLHLHEISDIARQQAETFVNVMTEEEAPTIPLVLAGDFNATPDVLQPFTYAPEQGGGGEFLEADHPENQATHRGGSKIDYVFGHRDYFTPLVNAEVVEPGECLGPLLDHPCSDHSALFGTLRFG